MTDHFKDAERLLSKAESSFAVANETGFPEGNTDLNRAHYYLQFANAHAVLAQVQTQGSGFEVVGRMIEGSPADNKEDRK